MSPRVVSIHYTLKDSDGEELETSVGGDPMSYLEGAKQIIHGLENALVGVAKGAKKTVQVAAQDAYGMREEQLIFKVPKAELPSNDIQVGDELFASFDGNERPVVIVEINNEFAMIDANHPLAGEDLSFEVEVVDVRDASAEEIEHGHAHGPGGHHH